MTAYRKKKRGGRTWGFNRDLSDSSYIELHDLQSYMYPNVTAWVGSDEMSIPSALRRMVLAFTKKNERNHVAT